MAAALSTPDSDERYQADRARHLERLAALDRPPVVIYAMGKTGTTAILEALRAGGFGPVVKVHNLRPKALQAMELRYRSTAPTARPVHLWEAEHLLANPATPEAPWTVITSVRDPIAQVVARFFQVGERFGNIDGATTVESVAAAMVDDWRLPLDWFDNQIRDRLGLDVYEHGFDPAVGWGTIETPSLRCLLLRMESMDVAPVALAHHLGAAEPIPIPRSNVAADKAYAALYREVRAQVRPPAAVVEEAYTSRMVRHFYAPEEIDGFRRHWSGDRGHGPA